MNKDKIIQIIPAPAGLFAHYSGDSGEPDFCLQAVCLALVEVYDRIDGKSQEVRAMVCCKKDDYLGFPDGETNFQGLCFDPNPREHLDEGDILLKKLSQM